MPDISKLTIPITLVITIGGSAITGGWWLVSNVALKSDVAPIERKVDTVFSAQLEYTTKRIGLLEQRLRDGKATPADVEDLRYFRERLNKLQELTE